MFRRGHGHAGKVDDRVDARNSCSITFGHDTQSENVLDSRFHGNAGSRIGCIRATGTATSGQPERLHPGNRNGYIRATGTATSGQPDRLHPGNRIGCIRSASGGGLRMQFASLVELMVRCVVQGAWSRGQGG